MATMYLRVESILIKTEEVERFKQSSAAGLEKLLAEPGVVSTALLQKVSDRARFIFIEAYVSEEAFNEHIQSECFAEWQNFVASMLSEDPESAEYAPIYPPEEDWVQASTRDAV